MHNYEFLLPQDIYLKHLAIICGLHFTRREIDAISCLVHARGTSKIASFLGISPNTVSGHIQNIMLKVHCNSREGIIDFVEKSHKLALIKKHYSTLVIYTAFEKALKSCSNLTTNPRSSLLIHCEEPFTQNALEHLKNHLGNACIDAEIQIQHTITNDHSCLLLVSVRCVEGEQERGQAPLLDLRKQRQISYYFSVFEILKKLCPSSNFEPIIQGFKEIEITMTESSFSNEGCLDNSKKQSHRTLVQRRNIASLHTKIFSFLKKYKNYLVCFFLIGLIGIATLISPERPSEQEKKMNSASRTKPLSIRSDLALPKDSVFLNRPKLMAEVEEKFKGAKGVHVVAFIGPGGAGKTTLAHQYLHQQVDRVTWEINAEDQESLRLSFEALAQSLAITGEGERSTGQAPWYHSRP